MSETKLGFRLEHAASKWTATPSVPDVNALVADILGGAAGDGRNREQSSYAATIVLNREHPSTFTGLFPAIAPFLDSTLVVYGTDATLGTVYNVALEMADAEEETSWRTTSITDWTWSSWESDWRSPVWVNAPRSQTYVVAPASVEESSDLETRFSALADEWTEESEFISVQAKTILLRSYQRIIAMGPAVIPLVLRRLRDQPDHWFWALSVLTDASPDADASTFDQARDAWLAWGEEHGYI